MGERTRRPRAIRLAAVTIVGFATIVAGLAVGTLAGPTPAGGPVGASSAELAALALEPGVEAALVWTGRSLVAGPRDEPNQIIDNGAPLDDWGDPASQLSESLGDWHFVAAAADDFTLPAGNLPTTAYLVTKIRAAFVFFNGGTGTETPAVWEGVDVTVYANSALDLPDGEPTLAGGHTGTVIADKFVVAAELTFEKVGPCRPCYVVDIPVDFILAKSTRFWLSLVPHYNAPPQTAWCLSATENAGLQAQRMASFGPVFWQLIEGNVGYCSGAPAAGTRKNLSFQLFGEELSTDAGACCDRSVGVCRNVNSPADCAGERDVFTGGTQCQFVTCLPVTGACCDDATSTCTDNVPITGCKGPTQRFSEGKACDELVPLCGVPGGCCFAGQVCQDLAMKVCESQGGAWHEGACGTFTCPPDNDACAAAATVTSGDHPFDTRGATTDGPALSPVPAGCAEVNQDVWFKYTAVCTGVLEVSLCTGTNYDSALAVYEGCTCTPNLGMQLACDDNGCGATPGASKVSLPVVEASCYLLRVGGVGLATGSGTLSLTCTPTFACCHNDGTCTAATEEQCTLAGGIFYDGEHCSPAMKCPTHNCCIGDNNEDGHLDGLDVQVFIERLLSPPERGSAAFCEADANADGHIDLDDIQFFVDRVLTGDPCPVITCCRGDTNGDGLLNGLDVQGLVDAIINPGSLNPIEYCQADVNEDGLVDSLDAVELVSKLMNGEPCPPP